MSMLDFLEQQLDKSGWLAFSHLTFDNAYVINIFNSRGYLAYSKANEMFINYNVLDSTDTENVEHKLVYMEPHKVGMQQVLTLDYSPIPICLRSIVVKRDLPLVSITTSSTIPRENPGLVSELSSGNCSMQITTDSLRC